MTRFLALLVCAALSACATSGDKTAQKPKTPQDYAKAAFDKREISIAVSADLREAAAGFVAKRLVDPGSAQFRFDYAASAGAQTAVCGAVNGRNDEGAYQGFQRFYVLVEGGAAKDGAIADGALEPRFIALCDASHPDYPSYPLRALQSETDDKEPAGVM